MKKKQEPLPYGRGSEKRSLDLEGEKSHVVGWGSVVGDSTADFRQMRFESIGIQTSKPIGFLKGNTGTCAKDCIKPVRVNQHGVARFKSE